ncbi:hypothetical protein [Stackebrandtia soli]|uniref:hypothetical protein n=1 Tax=Stackebrandtia soli TaxID=1892856 RepID=UPI0039E8BE78
MSDKGGDGAPKQGDAAGTDGRPFTPSSAWPPEQPTVNDWIGGESSWPPPRDATPNPDDGCRTHADTREPIAQTVDYELRAIAPIQAAWNAAHEDAAPAMSVPRRSTRIRPPRDGGRPAYSTARLARTCFAVVALALVSTFIAWVSAEPLWMSVGHRTEGTVTVRDCEAGGFAPRCEGAFVPAGEHAQSATVRISGDTDAERAGAELAAMAVGDTPRTVYIGTTAGLFLRWGLGLVLLAACGAGLVSAIGAWRMTGRAKRLALLVGFGSPFVMFLGALALTW